MNISFTSNYFINQGRNFPYKALDAIEDLGNIQISQEICPFNESCKTGIFSKITINSPEEHDEEIERILKYNNIDFNKSTIYDALNLENIKNRIILDPDFQNRFSLVLMDTDVLNELFKEDEVSYIEPNGANGLGNRYENFCKYLKTGKKIHAPLICINDYNNKLSASINDGRHRFAVLRDLGIKKIPVGVANYSLEIAEKYGLSFEIL